jgi:regulatory protein
MPAGVVTALEIQKRNTERVNVYLDDAYAFSLDMVAAAQLQRGQHLTEADVAALQAQDTVSQAVDRAARYLAYRPRSINEVRRYLAGKDVPEPAIDAALERLTDLGYVDDRAFASFWVSNRESFKPLSTRALRYELRQKGVADSDITAALAALDEQDAAYRAAQGQVRRYRGQSQAVFRQKVSAFLQRRGFNYDVIHDTLEQLIAEIEDPEYFTDEE